MKNEEMYLKLIGEACSIVEKLKLEDAYKAPAFTFVLHELATDAFQEAAPVTSQNFAGMSSQVRSREKIDALARELGVSTSELDRAFVWNGDRPEIVFKNLGAEKVTEKRQRLCHIYLTLRSFLFGDMEAEYQELKDLCENYGIKDERRQLSTNLTEYKYLVRLGKKGGRELKFRLTSPGKTEGIELIRGLLCGSHTIKQNEG